MVKTKRDILNETFEDKDFALISFTHNIRLLENVIDELENKEAKLLFDNLLDYLDNKFEEMMESGR